MARPRPEDKDLGEKLDLYLLAPAAAFAACSFLSHIQQNKCERAGEELQQVYEAYRDACAFDLLSSSESDPDESPSLLLAAGATEACERGKVVCVAGELLPAAGDTSYRIPTQGEFSVECLTRPEGRKGLTTTEALTASIIFFSESSSGDEPIKLPEETQEKLYLPAFPCTMSGAVAVDPEPLEPRLRPSPGVREALPGSPPCPLTTPFRTSDALPLPRSAHSYTDYFLGRKLKAMLLYVPSALRCLLVGRLVIDGGKLTLTAHPLAGFQLGFRGSPKAWLDALAAAALAPLQRARGDAQGWADARGASLACAGVLGGAWAVSRLCVALGRMFPPTPPPPPPPPSPPSLPPPSLLHSRAAAPQTALSTGPPAKIAAVLDPASSGGGGSHAGECVICLERPSVVVLLPCGHVCFCEPCAREMQLHGVRECPVCKSVYRGTQRIYAV